MVNGKWLMRNHKLLTVHEEELIAQAADIAKKIDSVPDRTRTIGAIEVDRAGRFDGGGIVRGAGQGQDNGQPAHRRGIEAG